MNQKEKHPPSDKETPKSPVNPKEEPAPSELKPEDNRDQLLRVKADFENTKKRLQRDKEEAIRFANEGLLVEMLAVTDNFDRAMTSISEGHDPEKVKEGLKIAQDQLHKILERHGVEVVKSMGVDFDPRFHEAVAAIETPDAKEGMIVDEVQKGYLLNGRLIRPSRVRISKGGSSNGK